MTEASARHETKVLRWPIRKIVNTRQSIVKFQVNVKKRNILNEEQIESLKEQIRIKDLQPRTTFTFDSNKHSDAVDNIKKGIITKKVQNGL